MHSLLKECELNFYYVTNIAKHRTWRVKGHQQKPDERTLKACAPVLRAEIDLVRPLGFILMGDVAACLVSTKNVEVKRVLGSPQSATSCCGGVSFVTARIMVLTRIQY